MNEIYSGDWKGVPTAGKGEDLGSHPVGCVIIIFGGHPRSNRTFFWNCFHFRLLLLFPLSSSSPGGVRVASSQSHWVGGGAHLEKTLWQQIQFPAKCSTNQIFRTRKNFSQQSTNLGGVVLASSFLWISKQVCFFCTNCNLFQLKIPTNYLMAPPTTNWGILVLPTTFFSPVQCVYCCSP